jgi:hypothetical protein
MALLNNPYIFILHFFLICLILFFSSVIYLCSLPLSPNCSHACTADIVTCWPIAWFLYSNGTSHTWNVSGCRNYWTTPRRSWRGRTCTRCVTEKTPTSFASRTSTVSHVTTFPLRNQSRLLHLVLWQREVIIVTLKHMFVYYQEFFWGVKRGRRLGLTTSRPSVRRLYRKCRILDAPQPYRPPRPVTRICLLATKCRWHYVKL